MSPPLSSTTRDETSGEIPVEHPQRLRHALPAWADADLTIVVADSDGTIIGSVPADPEKLGRPILDVLGVAQPVTALGSADTVEATLPNGTAALAAVRPLRNPLGTTCRRRDGEPRAHNMAFDHGADRYALGDDQLRRSHPRIRVSLAGHARQRGGSDPRHRARPH